MKRPESSARATPRSPRGVAVVVVREEKLLVIRRAQGVRAPGAYCFPGGSIEEGETEQQAVAREMAEELGAAAIPVRRLWQSTTPWGVELAWWLAEFSSEATLVANPQEVESWHWHTPDEIAALAGLLESNREFLAAWRQGLFSLG